MIIPLAIMRRIVGLSS